MNEVHSNYCKSVGLFYANFLLDHFCAFLLDYSVASRVTFLLFRSSFLSDLYCSHFEVKLVAEQEYQQEGTDSRIGSAAGEGSGGPCFGSRCGQKFLHP